MQRAKITSGHKERKGVQRVQRLALNVRKRRQSPVKVINNQTVDISYLESRRS
jgi:hypothetical protein